MKIRFTFLSVFFTFVFIYGNIIYNLPELKDDIVKNDSRILFNCNELFALPGEPLLPSTHIKLLLPSNADITSIDVKIDDIKEENIRFTGEVLPQSPYKATDNSIDPHVLRLVDGKNQSVYQKDAFFPKNYIRTVIPGIFRNYKIVDIIVQRYKYNPVKKALIKLKSGKVVVSYKNLLNYSGKKIYQSNEVEQRLKSIVNNYDDVRKTYNVIKRIPGFVIITTSDFKNSSSVLDYFAGIQKNAGYNVKIITENDWGGGTGDIAVDNIRNWLISHYETDNIEYAFIIGNPHKSSTVPMTEGPHASDDIPLVDYCYADLNGMLFVRGENKYYEYSKDGIAKLRFDQYPEISVGRLPLYNGVSEADKLLQRMIDYMTEPEEKAKNYRFNAFMPLNTFNDAQNGICFGEEVRRRLLDPNNFTYRRIYYDHAGTGADFPCSYNKTIEVWNQEDFGLMVLQGHGMVTFAEKVLSTTKAQEIVTNGYVHGFNISCHNGRPQDPSNLGYAIFKQAGISEVASAVQIWYSTTQTSNYGKGGTGNDFAFSYMDNLINYKQGAGACFSKTRSSLQITTINDWQNLCELNMYGNPAIGLYTYGVSGTVENVENKKTSNLLGSVRISNINELKFKLPFKYTNVSIELYSSSGKRVYFSTSRNVSIININYKKYGISNGLYLYKLTYDNKKVLSKGVVIIR